MQDGARQFHFRLRAGRALDPAALAGGAAGQVLQQGGLAHGRVTAYHPCLALSGPDPVDQPVQCAALVVAVRQRSRAAPSSRICRHRPAATSTSGATRRLLRTATPRQESTWWPRAPGPVLPAPSPLTES